MWENKVLCWCNIVVNRLDMGALIGIPSLGLKSEKRAWHSIFQSGTIIPSATLEQTDSRQFNLVTDHLD